MSDDNIYLIEIDGYDAAEPVGTSPASPFTRATTAHKLNGNEVAIDVARHEKGMIGEAITVEEGTINLLGNTDGCPTTMTGGGTTPPTVTKVDSSDNPFGAKVWRIVFPAGATTGYAGCRAITNNWAITSGQPYAHTLWVKGNLSSIVIYPTGMYGLNAMGPTGRSIDSWREYAVAGTVLGAGYNYLTLYLGDNTASDISIDVSVGQVENLPYWTSFHPGSRFPEYLSIPTSSVLPDSDHTIELWCKSFIDKQSYQMPINSWPYFYLSSYPRGDGKQYVVFSWLDGDSAQQVVNCGCFSVLEWNHFAIVRRNSRWLVYLNGMLIGESAETTFYEIPAVIEVGSTGLLIGYSFNGLVDDLRISNRARTAAEIAETHVRGLQGIPVPWDDATTALYRFDVAGVRTGYFCTGSGYISGDITYLPRVTQPGIIEGGASRKGSGDVTLQNVDGGLDHLRSYGFDGREQRRKVVSGTTITSLPTNIMSQPVFSMDDISFVLRDKQLLLDTPLQPNKYAGTGGLEGGSDIKNQPKPLAEGAPNNITPVLVNYATQTYQVNDGPVQSIPGVRGRGVFTLGTSHANSAALQVATVAAGTYDTCLTEGYFRLGSSPDGAVTCDVVIGAAAADRTHAQIARRTALKVLPQSDILEQSIIGSDALNSGVTGFYWRDETTVGAALTEIAVSADAWAGFDNYSVWNFRIRTLPGTNPLATITDSDNITIERLAGSIPAWSYALDYDRNFTVQTDLPASLGLQPYAALEYRASVPATDATIKTKHLTAPAVSAKTNMIDPTVVAAENARRLAYYKREVDPLKLSGPLGAFRYAAGGWWDDKSISDMVAGRYGHATVQHGSYVYVLGGYQGGGFTRSASVIRLNLDDPTGAWDDAGVTDLPAANAWLAAAVYGDWLYVIGGDLAGAFDCRAMRLDLTNPAGAWDETVTWPGGYANLSGHAIVVHDHYLYCLGGAAATVQRLDLNNPTGAWDDAGVTNLPATRSLMAAVVYGNHLYVLGGKISANPTASTIRLNLTNPTGAWDDAGVTNLPVGRYGAAWVLRGSTVCLMGGFITGVTADTATLQLDLSDPAGAWMVAALVRLPEGRIYASAIVYGLSVYLIAGYTGSALVANTYRYRSNDNILDRSKLYEIGQDICVKVPRYGYDAGKVMTIVDTVVNYETEEITMVVEG